MSRSSQAWPQIIRAGTDPQRFQRALIAEDHMDRRVFVKSEWTRRCNHGPESKLPSSHRVRYGAHRRAKGQNAHLPLSARGGGRAQRSSYRTARKRITRCAEHRNPSPSRPRPAARRRRERHRSRWIFRLAPFARAVEAAIRSSYARACSRSWKSKRHAVALRCAGLHGNRHAGREGHDRRLAQSLPRGAWHVRRVRAESVPRGCTDAADSADSRGCFGDRGNEQPR